MIRLYNYTNNFGDDLSPYIIAKLSGEKVVYRKPFSLINLLLDILRFIKLIFFKGKIVKSLLMYSPFHKVIISIGSILEESTQNSIVWGSGIGSRNVKIKGGNFLAVRGPYSQKRLAELNYKMPSIVGDPAILLPLLYPFQEKRRSTKFKIGIIPHIIDYKHLIDEVRIVGNNNINVIHLSGNNIEHIIDEILSCEYVFSSSLHGLIVSHAYQIPAIRFVNNQLSGDGIKFLDYFGSVQIENYPPIPFCELDLSNIDKLLGIMIKLEKHSLPLISIQTLQQNLINIAPFKILNKYKMKQYI